MGEEQSGNVDYKTVTHIKQRVSILPRTKFWGLKGKSIEVSWKVNIGIPFLIFMSICCMLYSSFPQSTPKVSVIAISVMGFKWFYFAFLTSWCPLCEFQILQELIRICCSFMVYGDIVYLTSQHY